MTDAELHSELAQLGLKPEQALLLAVIPLVQMAWADGSVALPERELIVDIARKKGLADEDGVKILDGWLKEEPSPYFLGRGRKLLSELTIRTGAQSLAPRTLEEVVAWCEGVAHAAGGVFGFGKVSASEREALGQIAQALGVKNPKAWADIKGDLGK